MLAYKQSSIAIFVWYLTNNKQTKGLKYPNKILIISFSRLRNSLSNELSIFYICENIGLFDGSICTKHIVYIN